MPGAFPVVGRTLGEAQDRFGELQELIDPVVGRSLLEQLTGADLSVYPDDAPVPALPETEGGKSRQALFVQIARREGLTIRELYLRAARARGHWIVVGTPAQVADALQERFEARGADGFNVMPPTLPGGLDDFAALVVPELQRRGLFRLDYEGATLRENLGLSRPGFRAANWAVG